VVGLNIRIIVGVLSRQTKRRACEQQPHQHLQTRQKLHPSTPTGTFGRVDTFSLCSMPQVGGPPSPGNKINKKLFTFNQILRQPTDDRNSLSIDCQAAIMQIYSDAPCQNEAAGFTQATGSNAAFTRISNPAFALLRDVVPYANRISRVVASSTKHGRA
jgi:hypothetical protein